MALHLGAGLALVGLIFAGAHACHQDPAAPVLQATAQAARNSAQANLSLRSAQAADRAAQRATQSQQAADEAQDAIRSTPSASDPVPDDLRSAQLAGIERVRQQADHDSAAQTPASDGASQPAPAVPAS